MPLYTFKDINTDELEDHMMKIAEKPGFLEDNPHLISQITSPRIVGGTGERLKVSGQHREIVNEIRKNHPLNTINDH
jgi:hypothetical protein